MVEDYLYRQRISFPTSHTVSLLGVMSDEYGDKVVILQHSHPCRFVPD